MKILGINAYHGDASACIVIDGKLVAAIEEERLNRVKHCAGLPTAATAFCLREVGIKFEELDTIAISRDPRANLSNKILYSVRNIFHKKSLFSSRLKTMGRIRSIRDDLAQSLGLTPTGKVAAIPVQYVEHHLAHMASSFFVSPFEEAALLSIDGFGDFVSTKIGVGRGNDIQVLDQICFPHSSGIIYTATTQYIGFPKYGDEGKVMGLAPYGKPIYLEEFRKMIRWRSDFRFELNLEYFRHHDGSLQMSWLDGSPTIGPVFSQKFVEVFGPVRQKGEPLTQHHKDIAASLQALLEEIYFNIVNHLHDRTRLDALCISGGVALNSVCNGKLFLQSKFKEVYIQPAAGDGGTSIGAAFYTWNALRRQPRTYVMRNAYTGPQFSDQEIERALQQHQLQADRLDDEALFKRTAEALADGEIIGWFQGRSEIGPRALGDRSIVCDPRRKEMKDILNKRIKHREPFRPFAPSVLAEKTGDFFEQSYPSPFMLMVYDVKADKREQVPAITHVDGSGRLQTVTQDENPKYYGLIKAFFEKTGVPIVLNTSFNENEPIVNKPEEAIQCFLKTKMDRLVLGNYFIDRRPNE